MSSSALAWKQMCRTPVLEYRATTSALYQARLDQQETLALMMRPRAWEDQR